MAHHPPLSAILTKVNALIDKALSTHSEEEARTCALTGVKLLRQYELRLVGKDDAPQETGAMGRAEKKRYEDLVRTAKTKIEAAEARAKAAEEELLRVKAGHESPEVARAMDLAGRWMRSRFSGACRRCGERIPKESKVWFLGKGKGVLCADCQWKRQVQRQRTA